MTRIVLLFRALLSLTNAVARNCPRSGSASTSRCGADHGCAHGLRVWVLLLAFSPSLVSQTYEVKLQVVPSAPQTFGTITDISRDADGRLRTELPGATGVQIDPLPGGGLLVHIQGSAPPSIALLPGQRSIISLQRPAAPSARLPYVVGYSRVERDGRPVESISWLPGYRAEGKLKLPACTMDLAVFDFDGDGLFDDTDSRRATTLGVDIDSDGRFYGAGEYRKMREIIDLCGQPLMVVALDPSGKSITLKSSGLSPAVLNQAIPDFSVTTTEGRVFRPESSRGRLFLLDFWASWCAPCVAKLQEVDKLAHQFERDLVVVGINVDEANRCASASRMVHEKNLSFQQVMRCQGESDFLWKMFGSMPGVRMAI
ncbi:MAG TPA: TlpA disulfide reductase family protein, partial [Bryobacteraceae bacterium]|nr:TlpA disulfide reductase family protein [Bryobacteraceae bacterium]